MALRNRQLVFMTQCQLFHAQGIEGSGRVTMNWKGYGAGWKGDKGVEGWKGDEGVIGGRA